MTESPSQESPSQEPVFAFLSNSAAGGGEAVKRIDTHAAAVFLAGARALKVKKAVRFPFLDYSTLTKRKQACEAELRINQPLAAQIYRRVLPITRAADGGLELDGAGEPVEWAVEMRRFDENATLDRLAESGRINASLADALGRAVAAGQAKSEPVEPAPWIKALADYIEEHASVFAGRPDVFAPEEAGALARASRAAYARLRPLLIERGQRGLIRRIHGDLHLGNVVLLEGRPVPFDAIEFSPLIASGDLLYDLAFLLMDLTERGLRPAANIVLNRYLIETKRLEDLDALAALPLFMSLRAAIRAKVTAARIVAPAPSLSPARGGGTGGGEQAELKTTARKYFDAARSCIAPGAPTLIAVGGFSGTGKSVLARALAPELAPPPGAVVLRSDMERKALFGLGEGERLPERAYTPPVTLRVFATLADKARRALAAGHSAIVDAVFSQGDERTLIEHSAAAIGVPFKGIFLTADLVTRIARVRGREHDASDADAAVARKQESYDLGMLEWTRIDAGGSAEETLARARSLLRG